MKYMRSEKPPRPQEQKESTLQKNYKNISLFPWLYATAVSFIIMY